MAEVAIESYMKNFNEFYNKFIDFYYKSRENNFYYTGKVPEIVEPNGNNYINKNAFYVTFLIDGKYEILNFDPMRDIFFFNSSEHADRNKFNKNGLTEYNQFEALTNVLKNEKDENEKDENKTFLKSKQISEVMIKCLKNESFEQSDRIIKYKEVDPKTYEKALILINLIQSCEKKVNFYFYNLNLSDCQEDFLTLFHFIYFPFIVKEINNDRSDPLTFAHFKEKFLNKDDPLLAVYYIMDILLRKVNNPEISFIYNAMDFNRKLLFIQNSMINQQNKFIIFNSYITHNIEYYINQFPKGTEDSYSNVQICFFDNFKETVNPLFKKEDENGGLSIYLRIKDKQINFYDESQIQLILDENDFQFFKIENDTLKIFIVKFKFNILFTKRKINSKEDFNKLMSDSKMEKGDKFFIIYGMYKSDNSGCIKTDGETFKFENLKYISNYSGDSMKRKITHDYYAFGKPPDSDSSSESSPESSPMQSNSESNSQLSTPFGTPIGSSADIQPPELTDETESDRQTVILPESEVKVEFVVPATPHKKEEEKKEIYYWAESSSNVFYVDERFIPLHDFSCDKITNKKTIKKRTLDYYKQEINKDSNKDDEIFDLKHSILSNEIYFNSDFDLIYFIFDKNKNILYCIEFDFYSLEKKEVTNDKNQMFEIKDYKKEEHQHFFNQKYINENIFSYEKKIIKFKIKYSEVERTNPLITCENFYKFLIYYLSFDQNCFFVSYYTSPEIKFLTIDKQIENVNFIHEIKIKNYYQNFKEPFFYEFVLNDKRFIMIFNSSIDNGPDERKFLIENKKEVDEIYQLQKEKFKYYVIGIIIFLFPMIDYIATITSIERVTNSKVDKNLIVPVDFDYNFFDKTETTVTPPNFSFLKNLPYKSAIIVSALIYAIYLEYKHSTYKIVLGDNYVQNKKELDQTLNLKKPTIKNVTKTELLIDDIKKQVTYRSLNKFIKIIDKKISSDEVENEFVVKKDLRKFKKNLIEFYEKSENHDKSYSPDLVEHSNAKVSTFLKDDKAFFVKLKKIFK